jgi:hypothetical protein
MIILLFQIEAGLSEDELLNTKINIQLKNTFNRSFPTIITESMLTLEARSLTPWYL